VRSSPLPEPAGAPPGVSPTAWAEALAYFKARSVADGAPGRRVLGADTLVTCDGRLLGKPRDAADARRMLRYQAGRAADVITGVALVRVDPAMSNCRLGHAVTRVWMRDDPAFIEAYVRSGQWKGKAGAYGIQDTGDALIERIEGSFDNVVGLPIELVQRLLGIEPR
jgi:septum formation protein